MELGEYVARYRKESGLTIDELASRSGVPKGTINKIIAGTTKSPTLDNVWAIAEALGKTLNDFYDSPTTKKAPSISDEAQKVAKDYDGLDIYGKTMVRVVLTEEQKRMAEEMRRRRERRDLYDEFSEFDGEPAEPRIIPLFLTPPAAGMVSPAFGEDFEYLEVKDDVPGYADFAVKIDGNSMEPYLMNGSIAYISRDPLADGDVGIFFLDGDMLCKQYHIDEDGDVHLLSLNRECADADRIIPAESGITMSCYGRVILPHKINVVEY